MKSIIFYTTKSGKCPVKAHLDTLSDNQVIKIAWVLKLIQELDQVPSKYLKKLSNTDNTWEIRVDVGKNTFRLLGFLQGRELVIVTNNERNKVSGKKKERVFK